MSTSESTYASLCRILVKNYQIAPERLQPDTPFDSLQIDSLGVIELVFAIEDAFGIRVQDADSRAAGDFGTLGELAAYVDQLILADAPRVAGKPALHDAAIRTPTSS